MPVLVTAFSPFGGREKNASSLALDVLRKKFPRIRTRILPVDSVIAPSRLRQAIRLIRPSAIIMLGEAAGSVGFRLETTAWNLLDFRIPDIVGKQPVGRLIKGGAPASLPSTLPLGEIYNRLQALRYPVTKSDDPGRYLCNQVFFSALHELGKLELKIPAGFIHLPLEDQFPTAKAARALSEIIRIVDTAAYEESMKYPH